MALFLVLAATTPSGALARNILVSPTGNKFPLMETVHDLAAVPWSQLKPGDRVGVEDGVYDTLVLIDAAGTSSDPIVVEAAPGATPRLSQPIVLEGARFVTLRGLTVEGAKLPGFIIRHGASDITIEHSAVRRSGLGIWIGDKAGAGHKLVGNEVADNATNGIAIDVVNAPADRPTIIVGNKVHHNGYHGLEINGSGYVVEDNVVFENGQKLSGTSGIHVYARDARQDAGDHNVIRYNMAYANRDPSGQDGNGIQIDQWCDDNIVAFNVVFGNDGAGINIFDGMRNTIANNTLLGNMRDPGRSHAYRGDLVVASDFTRNVDRARDNRIANNLIVSTMTRAVPIVVEATAGGDKNRFGPNMLFDRGGSALYEIGGLPATRPPGAAERQPDLVEAPRFRDESHPEAGGLGLSSSPSRRGAMMPAVRDKDGRAFPGGSASHFGAYHAE